MPYFPYFVILNDHVVPAPAGYVPPDSRLGHWCAPQDEYTMRNIARWLRNGFDGPACGGSGCTTGACYRDSNGFDIIGFDRDGYDTNGYNEDGYNSDGDLRPCGCGGDYCLDCNPGRTDSRLNPYSFKPRPVFHGDAAPYYGMEIEITTDEIGNTLEIVRQHAGDLIYCKEDGSVCGAELVTHPMSYEWAMTTFPWDMLPALKTGADATVISQENGIHVHVGRDGFAAPAHLYRWLKLWYRNPEPIQRIARRRATSWAKFSPEIQHAHGTHVKTFGKLNYWRPDDPTSWDRYQAVNLTNNNTVEVRVFASTLRPDHAKAALQLVAGSVEYTRQLDADAVCHRAGWEWGAFTDWADGTGLYPELIAEDRAKRARRFIG